MSKKRGEFRHLTHLSDRSGYIGDVRGFLFTPDDFTVVSGRFITSYLNAILV